MKLLIAGGAIWALLVLTFIVRKLVWHKEPQYIPHYRTWQTEHGSYGDVDYVEYDGTQWSWTAP